MIGARGAVATCAAYGLFGLREGLLEPVGLVTERDPLRRLPLLDYDHWVLGGHDVSSRDLSRSAGELVRAGVLNQDLVTSTSAEAAEFESNLRPGILDDADLGVPEVQPEVERRSALSPRERLAVITEDLESFRANHDLERIIVVNLASTEAHLDPRREWESLEAFDAALDEGVSQPASTLYAYAALHLGHPFVNFTPSAGSSIPALQRLADDRGVPHCGSDGKTGETLVKTVLAPMFAGRALKVLSWQGYNMLGNRDGEVLADPLHRESKLRSKDAVLRDILGEDDPHTHVGIDYVPSLGDWKTAWDYVHFEGFLGARMNLQFTWSGCDSALAAPLILDLARLTDFAAARGESGVMEHTSAFFKSPMAGGTHDFHQQMERLMAYAERYLKA